METGMPSNRLVCPVLTAARQASPRRPISWPSVPWVAFTAATLALLCATRGVAADPLADTVYSTPSPPRDSRAPIPFVFEANEGQTDAEVRFLARAGHATLYFLRNSVVFEVPADEPGRTCWPLANRVGGWVAETRSSTIAVHMHLAEASAGVEPRGEGLLETRVSSFHGRDPARWVSGAATYSQVRYANAYPGIDLVFGRYGEELTFALVPAPGSDLGAVELEIDGAEGLEVGDEGDLRLGLGGKREIVLRRLIAAQAGGDSLPPEGAFWCRKGGNRVGIDVGRAALAHALAIDPAVIFSTFVGGSAGEAFTAVKVDEDGNPVVVGTTWSPDFPRYSGLQMARRENDILVAKITADGSRYVFTATLGGAEYDGAHAVALDAAGNIVVAGESTFNDYPVVRPLQEFPGGSNDAVVTVLNPEATAILFSTYLGGRLEDYAYSVAVDARGRLVVGGLTLSRDFPVTPGAFQTEWRGWDGEGWRYGDGFVAAIDPVAPALEFSTFLGGWEPDGTFSVLADPSHDEIIAIGQTNSPDFPIEGSLQPWLAGETDITIVRLSADGSEMRFGSFLGGSSDEGVIGVLDNSGRLVLAGYTRSPDFPITPDALQGQYAGSDDVLLALLELHPPALRYATYLGGTGHDGAGSVAVGGDGSVWLAGSTDSGDFPGAHGSTLALSGLIDAFAARVNLNDNVLASSLLLGGNSFDIANGIALDRLGAAFVVGMTSSEDFPVKRALQDYWRGSRETEDSDSFIAKILPMPYPRTPRLPLRRAPQ